MSKELLIELAKQAGLAPIYEACDVPDVSYAYESWDVEIERFAELVRADERKSNIGCIGRIAAMVVDPIDQARLYEAMDAIRARSNT